MSLQLENEKIKKALTSLKSMINKCLLKVAHFDAQLEEYNLAIEHFEQVATDSIDNPLTKWSNKEYYLKAGLCSLCTNV